MDSITPEIVARFWAKVDKDSHPQGCWIWTASRKKDGYGTFAFTSKRIVSAHRLSFEIANGPIPDGLCVCHDCPDGDNPACVNPAHLWLGTQQENIADMTRKGRAARGDRSGTRLHPERIARGMQNGNYTHPESFPRGEQKFCSKLNAGKVRQIRRFVLQGVPITTIASKFGVTYQTIQSIRAGQTWRHVK